MKLYQFLIESKEKTQMPLKKALKLSQEIINKLGLKYINPFKISGDTTAEEDTAIPVGSIRRGKPFVNDIDILIVSKNINVSFIEEKLNIQVMTRGEKQIIFKYKNIPINLWILKDLEDFGAMLLHTTGPQKYNIVLRKVAKNQGLKINQYGVFKNDKKIKTPTEASLFKLIKTKNHPQGKDWVKPEDRI